VKAALYERHRAAAEVLRGADIERPDPGPGAVRVRVEVSGVNPTDWKLRSGATPQAIDRFQIPHHDAAGVIDAVGAGVSQERLGQRVWTWLAAAGRRWGTAAEWTVIPERQAVPLPEGVSPELGASLGVPAMTAWRCSGSCPTGARRWYAARLPSARPVSRSRGVCTTDRPDDPPTGSCRSSRKRQSRTFTGNQPTAGSN
jgi:NADPH2:quinone reductase